MRLLFLTIPFLFSCTPTPKKEIPGVPYNPEDYFQTKIVTVPKAAIDTTEPFLIAKGRDWFCYFYAYKIRFLYKNGRDSFITRTNLEYDIRNKTTLNPMTIGTKTDRFYIEIDPDYENEPAEPDTSRVKKIRIQLDKKNFEGHVTDAKN